MKETNIAVCIVAFVLGVILFTLANEIILKLPNNENIFKGKPKSFEKFSPRCLFIQYHVRFGDRVKMRWCISDSIDLTETMVPSFILQPIVENAFKHGIAPKEEGGAVRIRITPLREQGLLRISVCDNGLGIEPEQLARLQAGLAAPGDRWEHIGVYNVAARLRLLDKRCRFEVRSHPGRGTAVSLYLPLVELTEEEDLDDDSPVDCG